MRIASFLISLAFTVFLIILFNTTWMLPAPLGKLLSPQQGIWQNAEPTDVDYNANLSFDGLKAPATVYLDERLVPHIFADNDADGFFIQGYLHAKFRLWQMEFQTHAAGGRLTEVLGDKLGTTDILNVADRYFRRLGMTYAAEKALKMAQEDPTTRMMCDSYTEGVNAYIHTLTQSTLPLEYKLLGYNPEPWTNLKTALFLKYMSFDLAGYESDFEYTAARNIFTKAVFDKLYPVSQQFVDPILPHGTVFDKAGFKTVAPASADSLYFQYKKANPVFPREPQKPDRENGSNNWAVAGSKTKSHYPILCNDPHLGLNLPSLWFEMQLQTPNFNAYGVSFPGGPGIIIGFNDSCAFGLTNAGRDVRDYYEITFKEASKQEYLYNGSWKQTEFRLERYKIKNKPDFIDTVAYTVFGPVIFDEKYAGRSTDSSRSYAVRWKAHDPSNELKAIYDLDRSKNYLDYVRAARSFHTPGQNIVFAAKSGDIAIRAQGEFPAKWVRQGDFIMPGNDTSYQWQGMIPQAENPRMYNPERGFVSSANQFPADSAYPYYLSGSFPPYRGYIINRKLSEMHDITPQDMMALQTNNYDVFAEYFRPFLLNSMNESMLPSGASKYWEILKAWNLQYDLHEKGASIFSLLLDSLRKVVYADELAPIRNYLLPYESTLLDGLMHDSVYQFLDDVRTPQKETLKDDVMTAFLQVLPVIREADSLNKLEWTAYKDTRIRHLTRLNELSRLHVESGGGTRAINSVKQTHGPSWRMVVHLSPETEAYGVYPGGQQGNPGSRYYDNFIDQWSKGQYYKLEVLKKDEDDGRAKWKMEFGPEASKM